MKHRRFVGAMISIVAIAIYALLPNVVENFPLIGRELIWEVLAIVFAAGLALIFWPGPRKKRGLPIE